MLLWAWLSDFPCCLFFLLNRDLLACSHASMDQLHSSSYRCCRGHGLQVVLAPQVLACILCRQHRVMWHQGNIGKCQASLFLKGRMSSSGLYLGSCPRGVVAALVCGSQIQNHLLHLHEVAAVANHLPKKSHVCETTLSITSRPGAATPRARTCEAQTATSVRGGSSFSTSGWHHKDWAPSRPSMPP